MDQFTKQWYEEIVTILQLHYGRKMYERLREKHRETLDFYIPAVQLIDENQAQQIGCDGRRVAEVVAHISAWEEWQLQVFTSPNRYDLVRGIVQFQGYYDSQSDTVVDFRGADHFNAYQQEKHSTWSWLDIQNKAIGTALHLRALFPHNPSIWWLDFLERTPQVRWKNPYQGNLDVPTGLYLWIVSMEHEAVEHRGDLLFMEELIDENNQRKTIVG